MFPYLGTKKHELKHIRKYLPDMTNITKIYDVFSGSASVPKFIAENYPQCTEIHINDISPVVVGLYNVILSGEANLTQFAKDCEEIRKNSNFDILKEKWRNFDIKDNSIENVRMYFTLTKMKRTPTLLDNDPNRKTNFNTITKDNKKLYDANLCDKFVVTQVDYKKILNDLEALPAEERASIFVYLDPPYLTDTNIQRDDGFCSNEAFSANEMEYIINLMKRNTIKIMLNIGNNGLYRVIFGDMIKFAYPKTYSTSKKKTEHIIITNY